MDNAIAKVCRWLRYRWIRYIWWPARDRAAYWNERFMSAGAIVGAIVQGMARQRIREVAMWVDSRTEIRSDVCTHVALKVAHAHVCKVELGYAYWKALVRCRTCDEEWILQARTAGTFSNDPHSNIFRDSTT